MGGVLGVLSAFFVLLTSGLSLDSVCCDFVALVRIGMGLPLLALTRLLIASQLRAPALSPATCFIHSLSLSDRGASSMMPLSSNCVDCSMVG